MDKAHAYDLFDKLVCKPIRKACKGTVVIFEERTGNVFAKLPNNHHQYHIGNIADYAEDIVARFKEVSYKGAWA